MKQDETLVESHQLVGDMHSPGGERRRCLDRKRGATLGQPGLGAGHHAQGTWRWPSVTVRGKLQAKAAPHCPETCGHRLCQPAPRYEGADRNSGPVAESPCWLLREFHPLTVFFSRGACQLTRRRKGWKHALASDGRGALSRVRHSGISARCSQPQSRAVLR
jgi:hypothetical protein